MAQFDLYCVDVPLNVNGSSRLVRLHIIPFEISEVKIVKRATFRTYIHTYTRTYVRTYIRVTFVWKSVLCFQSPDLMCKWCIHHISSSVMVSHHNIFEIICVLFLRDHPWFEYCLAVYSCLMNLLY